MFEKEAENYAKDCEKEFHTSYGACLHSFRDGAEFWYNKANEWYYTKNGDYPKEYEDILICFLTEDDMKDCVRGWYEYDFENDIHIFKYLDALGTQYPKNVIAWKEFVLPKEIEK